MPTFFFLIDAIIGPVGPDRFLLRQLSAANGVPFGSMPTARFVGAPILVGGHPRAYGARIPGDPRPPPPPPIP